MKSGGAVRAQFMTRKCIADRNLTLTPVAMKHPLTLPGIITRMEGQVELHFGVDLVVTGGNQVNFGLRISDCGIDNERSINRRESRILNALPGIHQVVGDKARSALLPTVGNPQSEIGNSYAPGSRSTPQRLFPHCNALVVIIDGFAIDTRGDNHA